MTTLHIEQVAGFARTGQPDLIDLFGLALCDLCHGSLELVAAHATERQRPVGLSGR